ncbi:MAG TPA: hypothetical protein VK479_03130 [Micropepsaceae bacterium]|jgi:hypothetical protein|nr:hypothetical protein [Micropepsaceae bacterium]
MRLARLIPAVAALFFSGAAYAQTWDSYVNRENFFSINLPGEPAVKEAPYKTVKGTNLTASVFTAVAAAGTRSNGTYTVTVVDYSNAKNELGDAMEQARKAILAKGTPKYDAVNNMDMHRGWAMTVETPDKHRIMGQIIIAANNRIYISEADTPMNVPPPAQFQASLQILDKDGVRIRTRTVIAAPENEVGPVGAQANAAESAKVATLASGAWRTAGGSCEAAYFKSAGPAKTTRDEQALAGTIRNAGMTITGQLITAGAREGQFIDPKTDKAIMLFDPQEGGKLGMSAVGAPALGWPDVTLELCPGSRG